MQKLAKENGAIVVRRGDICCSALGGMLRAKPLKGAAEMLLVPASIMAMERTVAAAVLLISMVAPLYCNLNCFY